MVGRGLEVMYVGNVILGYWYPEWLQVILNILIGLFL